MRDYTTNISQIENLFVRKMKKQRKNSSLFRRKRMLSKLKKFQKKFIRKVSVLFILDSKDRKKY